MSLLCRIGIHKWIGLRHTHHCSFIGRFCVRCRRLQEHRLDGSYHTVPWSASAAGAVLNAVFNP